jgi:putative heme-binding domain-containing protein
VKALQMIPADHKKLSVEILTRVLGETDLEVKREAIRVLREKPAPDRKNALLGVSRDRQLPAEVRAEALLGLAEMAGEIIEKILPLAEGDDPVLRDEALRALIDVKLSAANREALKKTALKYPASVELVARLLGEPLSKNRPPPEKLDSWLIRLQGPANVDTGRRVFFHSRLGNCSACHRVDGRGKDIGPDLSSSGQTDRRHILESILQPSNTVAPHYQNWVLEMADGRTLTGMLMRTHLDDYTYVDARGALFKVNTRDIVESQPSRISIMPDRLADRFTDQELRDLLAYLESRK